MGAVGVVGQDPGVIEPDPARRPRRPALRAGGELAGDMGRVRAVARAIPVFWRSQAAVSRK